MGILIKTERANNRKTVSRQQQTTEITNVPLMPVIPRYLIFLFQVVLAFCFISFSGLHQSSSSSFNFVQGKTKLNIKSSGIDMGHASHILCASNRTLCEGIMELLEPFAEDDLLRPKLERGSKSSRGNSVAARQGRGTEGIWGTFREGEMTKDFDAIVFS